MSRFLEEFGAQAPALFFFAFLWIAMVAVSIFLIVSSIRKQNKGAARFGVVFLCIIVGMPTIFFALASGAVERCAASCAGHGVSAKDVFGVGFTAIGFCGILAMFLFTQRACKKYTTPVEAVCIDEKGPVFQITLYGEQYTLTRDMNPRHYHPEAGETRTLYIDENDLSSFYDPRADRFNRIYLRVFLSVVFTVFLIIGMILLTIGK